MRILFTTHPAYGHLHPLLPLASAARAAGHDVAIATSALFAPVVDATGFRSVAAGLDWLESDKSTVPPELKPRAGSTLEEYFAQQFVAAPALPMATDIVRLAETWRPDAIVRESTEFGGAIAADVLGVASAAVQVGNPSLITPAVLAAAGIPYNHARAALGLSADHGLAALEEQPVFAFAPPGLHDPAVPLPRNFIHLRPEAHDGEGPARLPAWAEDLGRDRPLIYATLGTVFNEPSYELPFFPAVLEGLRDEPIDLVVTVGPNADPASFGEQPVGVHVERYVPQSMLFPRVDVIACHGGFGTLLAAVEHGVPLVVVPFGADQYINAACVERLGIGIVLDADELTPGRMRGAVRTLLRNDGHRDRIRALRDIAAGLPPASAGIELLEHMARDVPSIATSASDVLGTEDYALWRTRTVEPEDLR